VELGDGSRDGFYFESKTWSLVDLPLGKTLINAQWVYKIKPSFDGKIDKLKARLVAKGYEQRPIIDFNKTFMLVCRYLSFGLMTKAKGYKVAGQEGSPRVMPHALGSARECEGIDPHTPKGTPILGIGVPVDS
jgi:hypothetical protein